jgi:adenylate cyclase
LLPVGLAVALFHVSPLRSTLDRAFFDFSVQHPARVTPPPDGSALVLMDKATMDALSERGLGGTWPPPRATFAALIAGLERAGAARIVLDFVFLDHSVAAEQDALLAGVAAGLPNVVLARTPKQGPAFWDEAFVTANAALFSTPRTGIAEGTPDDDGVLRRYSLPDSLAASAFADAHTSAWAHSPALLRWHGGLDQLRAHGERIPVLSAARFIVAGLPLVSRAAEVSPDFEPAALARAITAKPPLTGPGFDDVGGRVVFVGANAEGTFDQKPFAIGGLEPGVLFHWTAWANLTGHGFTRELPWWASPALALGFVALLALLAVRRGGLWLPVATAVVLIAGTAGGAFVALSAGWFVTPATPLAAVAFALLGVVAENFWTERQRRHEVQAMFGSYVAPEVVELLVRDPSAIRLGGERREATVFFCDLAGFTDLSEQVPPEQLLELINGYLQETSDCLMAHGAYIDKYIGDAVMAVFGAPKALEDHALAACHGALAAQRMLAERNVHLTAKYGRTLGLRIGLNSGDMIMGNLGSERKRNYTVLGDAVNLASRLEGANKEFGTRILVSEATASRVGDRLAFRPLTALRVKGKKTAVPVFELVGEPDMLTGEQRTFLESYNAAHALYTGRRFAEAALAFERTAALRPADLMTDRLLAETRRLTQYPPAADWQPIVALETK